VPIFAPLEARIPLNIAFDLILLLLGQVSLSSGVDIFNSRTAFWLEGGIDI